MCLGMVGFVNELWKSTIANKTLIEYAVYDRDGSFAEVEVVVGSQVRKSFRWPDMQEGKSIDLLLCNKQQPTFGDQVPNSQAV
jgi:hypothetical protein